MKILFVAPYVPNRIRVRPYQLIRTLVRRGHDITLYAVQSSKTDADDLHELVDLGVDTDTVYLPTWRSMGNCVQALFTDRPLQAIYSWNVDLAKRLQYQAANTDFDVIHIEHLRGSQYGIHLRTAQSHTNGTSPNIRASRIPIVWDSVDCISHLFEQASSESRSLRGRLITRLELNRTRKYEGWLVHKFDQVLVTSPADKAALMKLAVMGSELAIHGDAPGTDSSLDRKLNVLPNGVDLNYFTMGSEERSMAQIVFTGKMSYHANISAALHLVQDIMPLVWVQRPDAEVWIVGKDPSQEVRSLEKTAQQAAGQRRVYVTGTTSDLRPFLHRATIAVAPMLYGAGIQNKVLEAMACGAPVVASPQAASALSAEPGRDLLVASGANAFAEAILELLGQSERREQLGSAGRAYVERCHSWNEISERLEETYTSAVHSLGYVP